MSRTQLLVLAHLAIIAGALGTIVLIWKGKI